MLTNFDCFSFAEKRLALSDCLSINNNNNTNDENNEMTSCENCGKLEPKGVNKSKKKQPYCSTQCAAKAANTKSQSTTDEQMIIDKNDDNKKSSINNNHDASAKNISTCETTNGKPDHSIASSNNNQATTENGITTTATTVDAEPMPMISKWTVSDVCEFIKTLPGCSDYVEDFDNQEIDGQALLLLKENHLVSAMGMKLGPALKIVAKVESMKDNSMQEQ